MKPCQHRADYPTGFVIPAVASKIGKGSSVFGAIHEDRIFRVRQYARRAVSVPPVHEQAAEFLFVENGDLVSTPG
jgi:hypothetical protein